MTSFSNPPYNVSDLSEILSPSLIIFKDLVEQNLDRMLAIAGNAARLRPHCKTHKMSDIVQLQLDRDIKKHKAATIAECEMLAEAGVRDIFLAYNPVGPAINRVVQFCEQYPDVKLMVTADHRAPITQLGTAASHADRTVQVLLDLDTGQHRTGVPIDTEQHQTEALDIYQFIADTPGVEPGGLHLYDGQNHQQDLKEREAAVLAGWETTSAFRDQLVQAGCPVPRIVAGGTGSFPIYASLTDSSLELSPGTCVFHDIGYSTRFPDLEFTPAAVLITRVVSRPTADRVTVDLGYKAVASDPPAGQRVQFPDLPDAEQVLQNEEHLVLQTPNADQFQPGDILMAIPRHICPTSALHQNVTVVSNGEIIANWSVIARDRKLTV